MSKTAPVWAWEGWGGVPVGASEVDRLAAHAYEVLRTSPADTEVAFCMTGERVIVAEKDESGVVFIYDCIVQRVSKVP